MKKTKIFLKYLFLGTLGGAIYFLLEIFWRGYSHFSMFLLGGACFVALGLINEILPQKTPLPLQMLIGCAIITALEFATGCVVNLWLGLNVWDYSQKPFNLLGQISLGSSVAWYFLSAVGIILNDCLRFRFFGEAEPWYRLI